MKTASKATVLLSFVTLGLFSASPAQADLKEELREKMHSMEEKARRLKEEGKTEEFEKMKQEMKEFAEKAKQKHAEQMRAERMKAEANDKDKDKDKGKSNEKEERGGDEKAERREKEKKDASENANEKSKRQEHEEKQGQERVAHERKMMLHREEMERKRDGQNKGDQEGAEARMNHLKQAAEHLRAAGKPELAQQILQEGLDNNRKHQANHRPAKEDRSAPLSPELAQRIGNQFAEMHEVLRRLNQRLERLEKASKE